MERIKNCFIPLLFITIGFLICFYLISHKTQFETDYKEQRSGQKRLTNKLLDYDIPPSNELGTYKDDLQNLTNTFIQNKKAIQISVYYRDLNNGPWIGINFDHKFIPASLLKVPLMMVYFKEAESDPKILLRKYTFKANEAPYTTTMRFSKDELKDGKEYTVNELISKMIINSDNNALFLLANNINAEKQNELYKNLGLALPSTVSYSDEIITTRQMASFFRVLYNATYLNEEMSERALKLLTQTNFKKGIVKGVPKDIVVAQKYGERDTDGIIELHNCGIVYFPDHPYALCIMTKGTNFDNLTEIISQISKFTYEQVKIANK